MFLSKQNSAIIIKELNDIIKQKINIMDSNGIIIASTDESRIGQEHKAAKKMIDENLDELPVFSDNEYEGTLCGTNISLKLNNQIVGVVGITGPYHKVEKYGQIIKKMTEILIRDEYFKSQTAFTERIKNRYISELLFVEKQNLTKEFIEHGLAVGIDATINRRIFAITVLMKNAKNQFVEQQKLFESIYTTIRTIIGHENESFSLLSDMILFCAIKSRSDKEMMILLTELKNHLEKKWPVKIAIGIDSKTDDYRSIHQACIKAEKAVKTCMRSPDFEPRFYDNINMEIFSGELTDSVKKDYINHIFKNITHEELSESIKLLEIYYQNEGSISKTAEMLEIHKNTLQYKLKKIKELTSYDPRSIRFSSLFYNAIHFYNDLK